MNTITKECLNCCQNFEAPSREVKRGNGKFCSISCSSKFRGKTKPEPNVSCALCDKEFYMNSSKQKNSRSGLFFCCREHKDEAQRIGGIREIIPSHYGEVSKSYRVTAFRNYEHKCNRCGFSEVLEILEVHHKDSNRKNNLVENLEILCPTCHVRNHYEANNGKWGPKS